MRLLGLHRLWLYYKIAYYQWALSEMDPLHRDLPHVVTKLAALKLELKDGD